MPLPLPTPVPRFRRTCLSVALGAMLPATLALAAPSLPDALPPDAPVDLRIESLIDDIEHRDERAAKAQAAAASAHRRAQVEQLGVVPTDAALAFGRRAAAADPGNYRLRLRLIGLLHEAGYADEADAACAAILAEPPSAENAEPRQRALLKRARIAYGRRDLDAARHWLGELAAGGSVESFSADLEQVGERIARAERKQAMQLAVDRLGTEPVPDALDFGRAAAVQDPENLNLRLRLVALLGRAGHNGEADAMAEAFVADPLTAAAPYKRREALLERARLALARNDIDAAEYFVDQAGLLAVDVPAETPSSPTVVADGPDPLDAGSPPAPAARVEDPADLPADAVADAPADDPAMEQRIGDQQHQLRIQIQVARIGNVPTAETLAAAQALHQAEPASADAAFHYAALLRTAGEYRNAQSVYLALRTAVAADDVELIARVDERLESLRLAELIDRIGDVPTAETLAAAQSLYAAEPNSTDVALHYAALLRAGRSFSAAANVYREHRARVPQADAQTLARIDSRIEALRIAAELDRIGEVPTGTALAEARALYAREAAVADVGMHYAQMLRKHRDFAESEAVYREVAAGPGATDPDVAARAQLGIAEVYLAQGRARQASQVVAGLNGTSLSPGTSDRISTVGQRIDQRMPARGVTGYLLASGGHDSDAISRASDLDEDQLRSFEDVASSFQSVDAGAAFHQPLEQDGHELAVNVRGEHTAYNEDEASGVDRTVLGASIAPTFAVPRRDLRLTPGLEYRYRERGNAFSRRTGSAFLRVDGYASMRTQLTATYVFENSDDARDARDGTAHELGLRARYALGQHQRLLAEVRARDESADQDYESRTVVSTSLGFRHELPELLWRPAYWQVAAVHDRVRYDAADPANADPAGVIPNEARRDRNLRFDGILGMLLTPRWTAELRAGSLGRDSTAARFDGDSTRLAATLRYEFGGR